MPAEKQKRSLILILLALFVVSAIAILWAVKSRLHEHAVLEAESQIQNLLYTYSSVRQLIRQYHKPEVYRLISEGILSKDYFTPQLLSSTFNATSFIDILNKKLQQEHKPAVAFKLATDNPINPKNLADEKEQRLLKKMRNGEISHYKQIISSPTGEQILFYALPTDPVQPQCLLCHGNPQDAPAQMIQQYGNQSGFNETAGNIRALVSMHLPLKTYFEQANASFINIAILLLLIFSALFGIILYFLNTIEKKNRKITHQNKELAKLSITDALTGLMNRHGFREQFSKLVDIAKRHNEPLSVIMMDIDYFKEINDQCGHAAGDLVLETISKLLTKYQRTSDLVCRWGGEEFLIAQAKNDATEAAINAERIRVEIEKLTIPAEQREIKVTASFGIATLENSDRMESLINRADTALYDAKENGRNRVNTRL